jgi:hypothetical protein
MYFEKLLSLFNFETPVGSSKTWVKTTFTGGGRATVQETPTST